MNDLNLLEKLRVSFPFLNKIKPDMLKRFIKTIKIAKYTIGTVILEEGSSCSNMVFILDGIIRVYKLSPQGKEITLYRLENGETCVLSISCIMGNTNYPAIAEVEE